MAVRDDGHPFPDNFLSFSFHPSHLESPNGTTEAPVGPQRPSPQLSTAFQLPTSAFRLLTPPSDLWLLSPSEIRPPTSDIRPPTSDLRHLTCASPAY